MCAVEHAITTSIWILKHICTVCVRCITLSALCLPADPHYPWHSHHLRQPALDRPHTDVTTGAGCHGPSGKLFDSFNHCQRHFLQLLSSLSISQCDCSKVTKKHTHHALLVCVLVHQCAYLPSGSLSQDHNAPSNNDSLSLEFGLPCMGHHVLETGGWASQVHSITGEWRWWSVSELWLLWHWTAELCQSSFAVQSNVLCVSLLWFPLLPLPPSYPEPVQEKSADVAREGRELCKCSTDGAQYFANGHLEDPCLFLQMDAWLHMYVLYGSSRKFVKMCHVVESSDSETKSYCSVSLTTLCISYPSATSPLLSSPSFPPLPSLPFPSSFLSCSLSRSALAGVTSMPAKQRTSLSYSTSSPPTWPATTSRKASTHMYVNRNTEYVAL